MCVYIYIYTHTHGLPRWLSGQESACQCRRLKRRGFNPCVGKIPLSRKWQPTPVFLPRKIHRQRSLVGYIQSIRLQRVRHDLRHIYIYIRSVTQSCLTLCDPMNHSTPGLPVHHQFPEFTETHVHRVSDAIQPSHPLSSPSPLAPNLSQHQSLFI